MNLGIVTSLRSHLHRGLTRQVDAARGNLGQLTPDGLLGLSSGSRQIGFRLRSVWRNFRLRQGYGGQDDGRAKGGPQTHTR